LYLLTGQPFWPPRPRHGDRAEGQFVAGVYDGHAILVGKHHLHSLRIKDTKPGWDAHVTLDEARGEMPSGRGFLQDRYYFLPTTAAQLVKIDLALGKIVERVDTGQVLGNVIAFRGDIVSQNSDFVASFYQIEPLRERVAQRLAVAPDDAWALRTADPRREPAGRPDHPPQSLPIEPGRRRRSQHAGQHAAAGPARRF
jgi:hypothetical protein